ncbi:MAG: response regulator [Oscillochloris sp.]|nr:response regulator [Oscillochloris sp.]
MSAALIMIVDDHADNANLVTDYLTSKGYRTVVASDGQTALDIISVLMPDLVLMDIQMPGIDGLQAIQYIRADVRFQAMPIIALTALAMTGDRERCIEAGADEYVSKPVSMRILASIIASHLATRLL